MDSNSIEPESNNVYNLTDVQEESSNGNHQEVIVVDGRGYDNIDKNKKDIFNLVDVIEDTQTADNLYENILKQAATIVERIAREILPEIAERVIKEEIEKLKNNSMNE
jgi:hypothetical protein